MADRTLTHAASLLPIGAFAGKPAMPLTRSVVSVGSGKQNRVQLKSDTVSTNHALLVHTEAGWYVRDLGSRTHTLLNGKVAREATLKNGDTLTIGAFVFHFVTDERREPIAPVQAALEITDAELPVPLDTKTLVVGRRPGCEVRLLEETASLVHAVIFEADGVHYVRDLYSRNGTFLNGKKVHHERLNFGDEVVVGETHLKYVPDTSVQTYDDEALTPTPVESDPVALDAPIAIDDDAEIPLSTTARDTIDADREEGVEADAPVLPLSRRDRFESLAPSESHAPITIDAPSEIASLDVALVEPASVDEPLRPTAVRSDPDVAPTTDAHDERSDALSALRTTPDDDEADILGLIVPAGATHVVDDAVDASLTSAPAEPNAASTLATTVDERAEAIADALVTETMSASPLAIEPDVAIDAPAVASVEGASASIDDALGSPVADAQTAPDDDEADILGLAPPMHASHAVAPIDDAALAPVDESIESDAITPTAVRSDRFEATSDDAAAIEAIDVSEPPVHVRLPDVIAVPPVIAEIPEPPTEAIAADAPEPVDDFAAAAEAVAPVDENDDAALPTAAIQSALEPTAIEPTASPADPSDEAAALARLEARVRTALDDPSSASPLASLVSGDETADVATQLGEATRRARVIAEVLEDTEGFEADAAKQPIDFADAPALPDVPGHEATRALDAGAGAIVAPLDEAAPLDGPSPAVVEDDVGVAPLEFGEVPVEAALAPIDLDAALSPIDETVAPLALDEPASDAGFARDLGTSPGADEPVAPTLRAGEDQLVETSSTIEVVAEHAAPTLSSDAAEEPVADASDDAVIDVVAVPVAEADVVPTTIRDAMPLAEVDASATSEPIVASTPTSLGELQYAMPPAALSIDEDVRAPVDLPVAGDERAVEVADFRAPIEADAYRAGDVLGTSPIVATGPTPEERDAAQDAEARLIEAQDLIDAEELVVDQAALDAADARIDPPTFAPVFALAPDDAEPQAATEPLSSSVVDSAVALDLGVPLEHHARPLIAADEHLDEATHPHADLASLVVDVATIEPTPVAAAPTIDADALTASVADSLAPVAESRSPVVVSEAIPSDAEQTLGVETDDEIALAAGLPAHADVVNADAAASLSGESSELLSSTDSISESAAGVVADVAPPAASHFEVMRGTDEPTGVVIVTRAAPRSEIDDAFADALAMADGHTFAPSVLPPQPPMNAELAKQWQLDESILEQANHAPQGPIDPLAGGMSAGVEGFLNLGGIGYIGDPDTDEYEPAPTAKAKKQRKPRQRRAVDEALTPAPAEPDLPTSSDAPPEVPLDAELATLADAPEAPARKRPATPPRPTRLPPSKRGQAAVEQSFASNAPTMHSPFAEQALPLVDAFGGAFAGQSDAFGGGQPAEGLDAMLARLDHGDAAGRVHDQPPILADVPAFAAASALDAHARPLDGQLRGPRPASPTPTPFASHVPISSPTPPRPRRGPNAMRRPSNKLPMLSLLLLLGATIVSLAAWYWPVPRTLQGQLTFENLDKLNTIERRSVQESIRAKLAGLAPTARQRLDDVYGDGFLDHPDAFRAVADGAHFSEADPNALVVRVTSTVNAVAADRVRLAALLTAAHEANQELLDARDRLVAELRDLQKKQDAATAQRDATQRQLDIARPLAATLSTDLDTLRALDAELATLDQSRQAAMQTLAAREADLKRLEADAAAMGIDLHHDAVIAGSGWPSDAFANFAGEVLTATPIAARLVRSPANGIAFLTGGEIVAPSIDAAATTTTRPADLDDLARDRDAAKSRLDQLLQSQSPAARQAREGFDQALSAFAGDVETAGKTLGDRPEVLAYVQSARALQDQIRRMTDTLVRRQEQQITRLGAFKSRLADMNDSSRDKRYANDDQLKMWNDRLAIAQRRLNASKDAGAPANDVADIQREVSMAESSIAARKDLLDDPKASMVTRDLEAMIQTTQRDMAADRQQNERLLSDITDAFRKQQPAVEKLPEDQRQLAQQLAGRLAQIDLARQRYTNSLGLVAGGEAQAIADARQRFESLDQQLTQRRAQVDASAQAQAAEMERRGRIARSLDDARTMLIAARAARDQAENAYAARASTREALVRRIDVARHAGQQKDLLDEQLATSKADVAARIAQLDALQTRLKFAVSPQVFDPKNPDAIRELATDRVDPRLLIGAGGIVVLLCIFSPLFVQQFRRRGHHALAQSVLGDEHPTNFPPHATAA